MTEQIIIDGVKVKECEDFHISSSDGEYLCGEGECPCQPKLLECPQYVKLLTHRLQIASKAFRQIMNCKEGLPTARRLACTAINQIDPNWKENK